MIIRHSLQLLEQISDVEERIQRLERLMETLGIEVDRIKIIELVGQKTLIFRPDKKF